MNINTIEGIWLILCVVGIAFTGILLLDSLEEREMVRTVTNGRRKIRHIFVRGNIRREVIRLITQISLLGVALPSLLRAGEITLSFDFAAVGAFITTGTPTPEAIASFVTIAILLLMALPLLMLATSFFDRRDRTRLRELALQVVIEDKMVTDDAVAEALLVEREHPFS